MEITTWLGYNPKACRRAGGDACPPPPGGAGAGAGGVRDCSPALPYLGERWAQAAEEGWNVSEARFCG